VTLRLALSFPLVGCERIRDSFPLSVNSGTDVSMSKLYRCHTGNWRVSRECFRSSGSGPAFDVGELGGSVVAADTALPVASTFAQRRSGVRSVEPCKRRAQSHTEEVGVARVGGQAATLTLPTPRRCLKRERRLTAW